MTPVVGHYSNSPCSFQNLSKLLSKNVEPATLEEAKEAYIYIFFKSRANTIMTHTKIVEPVLKYSVLSQSLTGQSTFLVQNSVAELFA